MGKPTPPTLFLVLALTLAVSMAGAGAAAAHGAESLRQILQDTRWVRTVTVLSETPSRTVLQVVCTENPAYVVEELCQEPTLRVRRYDAPAATVEEPEG